MKKLITILVTAFSIASLKAQESVDFIQRIDSIKTHHLKRCVLPEMNTYYIPQDAVDSYLQQFDKLRFNKKTKVKCFYSGDFYGGRPYLYIHRLSDSAIRKKGKDINWLKKHAAANFVAPVDDTPMAYFQYLIFSEYGEMFSFFWHENYNMKEVHVTTYSPAMAKNREEAERMAKEQLDRAKEYLDEEIKELRTELRKENLSDKEIDELIKELYFYGKESNEEEFELMVNIYLEPSRKIFFGDIVDEELNREINEKGMAPKITADINYYVITLFEENHEYLTQKTYHVQRKKPWKIEL